MRALRAADRALHRHLALADVPAAGAHEIVLAHAVKIGLGAGIHLRGFFLDDLGHHAAEGGTHQVLGDGIIGLHLVPINPGCGQVRAERLHGLHRVPARARLRRQS